MQQIFLNAWQKQAFWLWLLLPIAWLYRLIIWLNQKIYQMGLKQTFYAPVPVIVIGNITVGGSGKTPLIIALVQYLQKKGVNVGVISRGYGGDTTQMPTIVTTASTPSDVGDEPCLIVQTTHVPMAVCPNRGQAIELLLNQNPDIQLILADDGLQHHALDRDKNWIVVDKQRGFGNEQLLPVGFLREPISRLQKDDSTVIYHLHTVSVEHELTMRLQQQPIQPLLAESPKESLGKSLDEMPKTLSPQQVIAMSGIGYPKRFFTSLAELGFSLIEKPFDDHHHFILDDFANLPDLPIVITGKDAVKVRLLFNNPQLNDQQIALSKKIWVLPVAAVLSQAVYDTLDKQLGEMGIGV